MAFHFYDVPRLVTSHSNTGFLKPKSHSGETKIWKNHVFRLVTSRKPKRQQKGKEKSTYKKKALEDTNQLTPPEQKKRRILIPSFKVPKQTNKQTNKRTNKQTNKPTNKQTNKQKSTNPPKEKTKEKKRNIPGKPMKIFGRIF